VFWIWICELHWSVFLISALSSYPVQYLFFQLISWINDLYHQILTSLRLPFLYDYWIISDKGLFRRNHLSFHMWMNNETLFPLESTSLPFNLLSIGIYRNNKF
jgi:hypothetical protein